MNNADQIIELESENMRLRRQVAALKKEMLDSRARCCCDLVAGESDCWVWEINTEGRYTRSSESVHQILGYSVEEVIGRHCYEFFPLAVRDVLTEKSLKLFCAKCSFAGFLNRALHKDGRMVILEATGFPICGEGGELLGFRGVNRDITARTRAEEALQENEKRFRTLVETIPNLIFVIDEHGRILEVYGARLNLSYVPPEEFLGKLISEVISPDLMSRLLKTIHIVLTENTVQTLDYSLGLHDQMRFFTSRISPLPPRGGLRRVLALVTDITTRVEGERTLLEANKKLARILDTMEEGLLVINAENRVTQLNRKACELFQYSKEEIVGQTYQFWCHPDSVDCLEKELKKRKKGERSTYEALYRRKDRSSFWARVAAVPITDEHGRYRGSISCLSDITAEKRVAAELRRLHEFNEKLIQVVGVWISVVDEHKRITLWNNEAERVSGYSRQEVIGHDRVWEWLYPDTKYREAIRQRERRIELEGEREQRTETTICTKAGEKRVIAWCGSPLFNADGTRSGVVDVGVDITEQKRNEQRLQAYAATVSHLNEEKDRFLSTTSHELRTPLAAIRGFADLLVREDNLTADQRMKAERIRAQAERLNSFLTNLLDISRIEANRSDLIPQEIDLSSIVEKVCDTLRSESDRKEQLLVRSHRSRRVYADPVALEHVLLNLLSNAVAYTPSRGLIVVEDHDMDGVVQIDISDNGIGIPLAEQKKIFNGFYRTKEAQRMNKDGTGLGLAIVKRLVKDMNGSIWVRSTGKEREGSTFSFTLPAVAAVLTRGHAEHKQLLKGENANPDL